MDSEPSSSNSDLHNDTTTSENTLQNWTKEEKFELFQALKAIGSHNIQAIQEGIPTKSVLEIEAAVKHYKSLALNHKNQNPVKKNIWLRSRGQELPRVPLNNWAKLLTDTYSYESLQTEIATALRLIAQFEDIPSEMVTEGLDFRKAYHLLANAVEGKSLEDDKAVTVLITKAIMDISLTARALFRSTNFRDIIRKATESMEEDLRKFNKPNVETELETLTHLIMQKNYNPFNIPQEYLNHTPNID